MGKLDHGANNNNNNNMTLVRGASTWRKEGLVSTAQTAPSSAFLEKRQKELDRLRTRIASQLSADLETLYATSDNANLVIGVGNKKFLVHKEIVQVRNPSLFGRLLREAVFTPGGSKVEDDDDDGDSLPRFDVDFADENSVDEFFK